MPARVNLTLGFEIAIMIGSLEPNFWNMAETDKKTSAKSPMASASKHAEKVTKVADEVFGKLKKHFEPKKVDAWQKKWLEVPENRKKYEKLADAPEVAGEEFMAMANDIINFAQGEEGGQSNVFKKVKAKTAGFFKDPIGFLHEKAAKGKEMANKAKGAADKAKDKAVKTTKK